MSCNTEDIQLLIVDLFCGAGGVTTGFEKTKGCKVICCINHDPKAIESHEANYPDAIHFIEDIREVSIAKLYAVVEEFRKQYPNAKLGVHASLECINFSKAKGGLPKDADSRSLADDMPRYLRGLNPDYFTIENVMEFMSWGPLDENGRPISKTEGTDYIRWVNEMKLIGEGYDFDYRQLNAADYGAYTSRKRFFGIFAKKGMQITWPSPTHAKNPEKVPMLNLKKWKAVRDVLDLQSKGTSIFGRKKNLSEKTLERIYAGLTRFASNKQTDSVFIQKYYSGNPESKVISVEEPSPTITTIDHNSLVFTNQFLIQYNGKTQDGLNKLDKPIGTLCTKDRFALAESQFIVRDFSSGFLGSIENPCGALLTVPKVNLVTSEMFYLMNPQWGLQNRSIEEPCFTLIARMDKTPPYLVEVSNGEYYIKVMETDSPMMIKIKKFMAENGIIDVKMRMLYVKELLKIQGFPEDYKLVGNQQEQKKFVGNSVETNVMSALASSLINQIQYKKAI